MPFFVTESLSSTLVTVILMLAVLISESARMVSMATRDSNHLRVQTSLILSAPTSTPLFSSSMCPVCLPNLLRSTLCILSRCHFWYLVTSRMARLICFAAICLVSLSVGSSMPLVTVNFSNLLKFIFSLYGVH